MILPAHCIGGRHSEVERKGKYPIKHIVELIGGSKRFVILDGDMIFIHDKKLRLFNIKGCKCVKCGLKGEFFAKEMELHNVKNNNCKSFALQLYGRNKNGEVIITMDHIIPKSKGGTGNLYNLQPMCYVCNQNKKSDMPTIKERLTVWVDKNKKNNTMVWKVIKFFKFRKG